MDQHDTRGVFPPIFDGVGGGQEAESDVRDGTEAHFGVHRLSRHHSPSGDSVCWLLWKLRVSEYSRTILWRRYSITRGEELHGFMDPWLLSSRQ